MKYVYFSATQGIQKLEKTQFFFHLHLFGLISAHEAVRKYFSGEEAKVVVDVASVGFGEFEGGVNGDPNVDLDAHNYQVRIYFWFFYG